MSYKKFTTTALAADNDGKCFCPNCLVVKKFTIVTVEKEGIRYDGYECQTCHDNWLHRRQEYFLKEDRYGAGYITKPDGTIFFAGTHVEQSVCDELNRLRAEINDIKKDMRWIKNCADSDEGSFVLISERAAKYVGP